MNSNRSAPLLILLDAETRIVAVDAPLATALDRRQGDLVGHPFSELVGPEDLATIGAQLVALVRGEPASPVLVGLRDAPGNTLDAEVFAAARHDDGADAAGDPGAPSGFSLTVRLGAPASTLPDHLRRVRLPAAILEASGEITDCNAAWADLFGTGSFAAGALADVVVDEHDRVELRAWIAQLSQGTARTTRMQMQCRTASGQVWCKLSLASLDGSPGVLTATAEDISTEHLTNRVLSANEALFRSLAESSPVGMARLAPDLTITYRTPSWKRLTATPDQDAPTDLASTLFDEGRAKVLEELRDRIARGSDAAVRARVGTSARERWVHLRLSAIDDDELGPMGYVATVEDITDLVAANESQSQLAGIVESTSDLVGIADLRTGKVLYLNAAAQRLFVPDDAPADLQITDLYAVGQIQRYQDDIYPVLRRGETWTGELTMRRHDGTELRVLQTVAAEVGPDGEPERASVLGRDVSNERQVLDELAYKATHDHLTGLPNRSLLVDHLELALARSARDRTPVAVLFIDLDHFKSVNDTYGHDVGDDLLREVSARMSTVLRPSDTVARLGGDEFVVVCDDIEGELDAMTIAGRIRTALEDTPLYLGDQHMMISASIGIAMSNGGSTRDPETLLKQADSAMYRAKNSGRARTEIFDDDLRDRTRRRVEMGRQLGDAIAADILELHYQPIVDLHSGRVTAVEAFVRWPHTDQGMLTPTDFLPLARETGLDEDLDALVIQRACSTARRWELELGDASPPIHVNMSGTTLLSGRLSQRLDQCLRATGVSPDKLCLELSELFLMTNGDTKSDRLDQIRALGVRLCIDDVGTGATVFPRLGRYGLDVLKLDAVLTADVVDSEDASQLVQAVAALGRTLGLQVAAERVERREAIPVLRELGVQVAQGHVFSPPLPAEKIEPLLTLRSTLARADR